MDSSTTDEHLASLCSMGFDCAESKRALTIAKGDLNEAVAILTGDNTTSNFGPLYDLDTEMKETGTDSGGYVAPSSGSSSIVYGPSLPPSYDEVVDTTDSSSRVSTHTQVNI